MSTGGFPAPPALNKPRKPQTGLSPRGASESLSDYMGHDVGGGGSAAAGAGSPGGYVPSPSPYTDLSNLSIPEDPQEMFKVCKFLAVWSPVHKAFVRNMACLPATEPILKPKNQLPRRGKKIRAENTDSWAVPEDPLTDRLREILDDSIRLKKFNQRAGVQFWTYSSAVVQIHFPFIKMLACLGCSKSFRADQSDWLLREDGKFEAACVHCGQSGSKLATDRYIRSPMDIKLSIPDMTQIHTIRSGAGDDVEVYFKIPDYDIKRLRSTEEADRNFILRQPQAYIEAALGLQRYGGWMGDKPFVKLRGDQHYLMRNVHLEFAEHGIPIPAFLASLKDYWQMRQLQRASEAISNMHIYPVDMVYPESSARSGNLFELINVSSYMDVIRRELAQCRQDPNYRPVMPFPVASHRIGGDGKSLLLSSEIRVYMEILCAALECPIEFIFGGLSYSGSDVSIQQMIKKIEDYRADLLAMNKWVVKRINEVMGWPGIIVEFEDFRLGQDLPYIQMVASLKGQYSVGSRRLHRLLRVDTDTEREDILEDVLFEMELQRKRMKLDARTQQEVMLRETMGQAEGQVKGQETMLEESRKLAERVRADPVMFKHVMASPELAAQIFGQSSPEVMQISNRVLQSQLPQQPDPALIAPQAAAEWSADQTLSSIDPQAVTDLLGSMAPQPTPRPQESGYDIGRLVRSFSEMDPMHWGGALQMISSDLGMDVARQVQAQLFEAQAYLGQRSPYAKGQRSASMDYGTPF